MGEGIDGALFIVQRLEEMLFHYSDDILKAPIHNLAMLIEEYIKTDSDKNIKNKHYLDAVLLVLTALIIAT